MIGNYWLAVLAGLLIGSVVTVVGMYLLGFRRVHRGRRTRLVPEIDRRPLQVRWREFRQRVADFELTPRMMVALVSLMVVAVFAGLVQNTTFNIHQRDENVHQSQCNDEFRSTSLELRRIATEDRALEAQDDELRNARDDAMKALIETLVTPPPPGERVDALGALNNYRAVTEPIDVRRDQLVEERAKLEQQRREQPVPPERC